MSRAPVIGSYRRPAPAEEATSTDVPEIVDRRQKVETPATALSEGIQENIKESIEKTKGSTEKAKSYEQVLAERDIPIEKAHAIVDAMLERGYYEEDIGLKLPTTTPIRVTFRTRTHADYVRYLRALEAYMPKFVDEQREIQMRYFMAASLVAYKGHVFEDSGDKQKDFDRKLDWIEAQPERLIHLLAQKLTMFDLQVQAVMSEGAVENF